MYTALYRAYRPEVFDEILGQGHIIKILKIFDITFEELKQIIKLMLNMDI